MNKTTTALDSSSIAADLVENLFDELKVLGVNLLIDTPMNAKDPVIVHKKNYILHCRSDIAPGAKPQISYEPLKKKPTATLVRSTNLAEELNPVTEILNQIGKTTSTPTPTPAEFLAQYVTDACRTESEPDDAMFDRVAKALRLIHAVMGMLTELGELADPLKKYIFYGKEIDTVNLSEELGDMLWYMAIMLDDLDMDMVAILEANIAKLRARYPAKYTHDDAEHRDLSREREALEGDTGDTTIECGGCKHTYTVDQTVVGHTCPRCAE